MTIQKSLAAAMLLLVSVLTCQDLVNATPIAVEPSCDVELLYANGRMEYEKGEYRKAKEFLESAYVCGPYVNVEEPAKARIGENMYRYRRSIL